MDNILANENSRWFTCSVSALLSHFYLYSVSAAIKAPTDRKYELDFEIGENKSNFNFKVYPNAFLMYGYSVELLMKFMVNCKINNSNRTAKYKHNLHLLLNMVNELYKGNKLMIYSDFVKGYQEFIEWLGKYPFPNDPNKNSHLNLDVVRMTDLQRKTKEFWTKLLTVFTKELKNDTQVNEFETLKKLATGVMTESIDNDRFVEYIKESAIQRIADIGEYENLHKV